MHWLKRFTECVKWSITALYSRPWENIVRLTLGPSDKILSNIWSDSQNEDWFHKFWKMGNFGNEKGRTSFTSILKWKSSGKGPIWNISTQRTAVSPRNNTAIHLWLGRSVVSRFWVVWPSFCSLVASPLTPPWQQTCPRCLWHSDNLK